MVLAKWHWVSGPNKSLVATKHPFFRGFFDSWAQLPRGLHEESKNPYFYQFRADCMVVVSRRTSLQAWSGNASFPADAPSLCERSKSITLLVMKPLRGFL